VVGVGEVLLAPVMTLRDRTAAGEIGANTINAGPGVVTGPRSPYVAPPAAPAIAAFTVGTAAVNVNGGQTQSLAPGKYLSSPIALMTSSTIGSGTIVRRIAVHFCPAFDVISRTTSLTKRSNSSVPGFDSGPSIEKLSESASWLNRVEFSTIAFPDLSLRPVVADPVKVTTSCPPT